MLGFPLSDGDKAGVNCEGAFSGRVEPCREAEAVSFSCFACPISD